MLEGLIAVTLPAQILRHIDVLWTFFLLMARYGAMMSILPGIGMGPRSLLVRLPAVMALSVASIVTSKTAPVPPNGIAMVLSIVGEVLFGTIVGFIPMVIVSSAQIAGHFAATSMGLNTANQLDPNLGISTSDISKLYGDLATVLFLLLGGHHAVIYAASATTQALPPGTFIPNELTVSLLIERTSKIFETGFILASPVIVALLLTQFALGLISKAVPTVNIFIVSFPLTIGIGLILTALALPDMMILLSKEIASIDNILEILTRKVL